MDWQQIVLFGILGLGAGSLIAGIAVGIVVTFRGSGIINLATGAVAMVAGYTYWSLKTGTYGVDMPTAPALVITALFLLVIGLGVELAVFRPLRTAAPLAKLAASLGLLLVAQASVSLAFGIGTKPQPPVLPGRHRHGVRLQRADRPLHPARASSSPRRSCCRSPTG